jgi:NAD(P)-dependent dehydrogenase (short-subunit alcohol dehydrogenase family)
MKKLTVSKGVSPRDFLRISGFAAGAGILAACTPQPTAAPAEPTKPGESNAQSTQAPAAAKGSVDLIYWDNKAFEFYQKPWDEKFSALIAEKIPEAKLTIQHAQNGDKFLTAVNAGTPPDVYFTWDQSGKVGSWITSGLLISLDNYMTAGGLTKDEFPAGMLDQAVYNGQVYGILGLTQVLALELACDGIRVNAIAPGSIDTAWLWGSLEGEALVEARKICDEVQPVGYTGTPTQTARAAVWLARNEVDFMTGACLLIDGGMMAKFPGPM